MTRTMKCVVQPGPRPRRDYTFHCLSGQVGKLALGTAQYTVGANLGYTLCNFRRKTRGLSLQIALSKMYKVRSQQGDLDLPKGCEKKAKLKDGVNLSAYLTKC